MKVLLATDGSVHAKSAVEFLRAFPWTEDPEVQILATWPPLRSGFLENFWSEESKKETLEAEIKARMEGILGKVRKDLEGFSCKLNAVAMEGPAAERILEQAKKKSIDLILMGTRGLNRMEEIFLGSVSRLVLRNAPCSVALARPQPQTIPAIPSQINRILLPTDGSPRAQSACDFILKHAADQLEVEVLGVIPKHELMLSDGGTWKLYQEFIQAEIRQAKEATRSLADELTSDGRQATWEVEEGDPAETIVEQAQKKGAQLVVLGHKGSEDNAQFKLGSVAERVAQLSKCSVLVVR